jgi:hypothetical protein
MIVTAWLKYGYQWPFFRFSKDILSRLLGHAWTFSVTLELSCCHTKNVIPDGVNKT